MKAQLIINADDYAISPGVSRGIRELIPAGRVTATSCMTGSGFWEEEGRKLREIERPPFSAGLHLTLSDQASCAITPTLAPDGILPSLGGLWRGVLTGRIARSDVKREIHAQITRFIDVFGAPPGHVDGHHHVQQMPVVRQLVLELWRDGTLPPETWLRVSSESLPRIVRRGSDPAKAAMIAIAGRGLGKAAKRVGIPVNDGFAGVYSLRPGSDFPRVCARALAFPAPRMLFMCHPGYADPALADKDSVTGQRETELEFMKSDAFGRMLSAFDGTLVSSIK